MVGIKEKNISKILIVGFGSIGERHLRVARSLFPDAQIALLRRSKSEKVPQFADLCFNSISDAMLFSAQIAVICNPATEHIKIGSILINNQTNLLIEKPISSSASGVVDLLNKADRRGVKIAIGYNLRFNKSLNKFKELIESGIAGEILSVRVEIGQYLPSWRPGKDYRNSVSSQQKLGGGVLNELSHEIDYIQWIFGQIKSVQAEIGRFGNLEIDVEDTAILILKIIKKNDNREILVSVNMDFIRHDSSRTCVAIGEKGTLKWDAMSGTVQFYPEGGRDIQEIYRETTPNDESYLAEWKSFVKNIERNDTPECDGYSALSVVKVIEAAKDSSCTGKKVYIN